ncbi:MAG: DUF364 domain-containing protein, partial [Chloroflexota bacterium]
SRQMEGDSPVADVRIGLHWTVLVTEDGRSGIANSNFEAHEVHGTTDVRDAGKLVGKSTRELAGLALTGGPVERGLGVVALNALLPAPDESSLFDLNAADLILERCTGAAVAIVGHFPFIERVRQAADRLWVIELNPGPGEFEAEKAPELLPQADIAAITGSAIVNGTLDQLLSWCKPDTFVLVLGPSTPLHPILFDRGVDAIAGSLVVDPELCMTYVGQGTTFRQIRGIRKVIMQQHIG